MATGLPDLDLYHPWALGVEADRDWRVAAARQAAFGASPLG